MNKETQDLAWACLPKEVRESTRNDYKDFCNRYKTINSNLSRGAIDTLEDLYGHHNLTSDTEPQEMLMVERNKVVDIFAKYALLKSNIQEFDRGVHYALKVLFGDKCLPDKESEQSNLCDTCSNELKDSPDCSYFDSCGIKSCSDYKSKEQPRPKFKVGDKVIVSHINTYFTSKVVEVNKIYLQFTYKLKNLPDVWFAESVLKPYTEPETKSFRVEDKVRVKGTKQIGTIKEPYSNDVGYRVYFEDGDGGWDKEYSADELEPYTKPETKDNMERKEFDLTEILKGCEGEKIFLVDQGECWIKSVTDDKITLIFNGNAIIELSGESVLIQRTGFAYAYPSKESFLANPLDAYSAWMEWKESRKPKRWRAKQNKEFYYFLDDMLIINDIVDSYDYFCNNRYNIGNYFRTTEEAQQAAEAVRECLKNLIKNTNKDQLSHESNS